MKDLLDAVIEKVPPPSHRTGTDGAKGSDKGTARALIFDSLYDDHRGILAYMRVFDGSIGSRRRHAKSWPPPAASSKIKEAGYFSPQLTSTPRISSGEIGYIATGLKEPEKVKIGDTVLKLQEGDLRGAAAVEQLPGYREPAPVVFISFYPDAATKFDDLKKGLEACG